MGKLTHAEAEELVNQGIMTRTSFQKMQNEGLISTRGRNTAVWVKAKDGAWVSPQLYFKGQNGSEYSKSQLAIKDGFNALVEKHCTTKTQTK